MPERLGSRRLPRLEQQASRWLCWSGPTGSARAGGHATTAYGSTRRAGCPRSPAIAPAAGATASTRPRDAWIRYLEDYAAHHRIDVRFGTQVRRLEPAEEEWRLETDGEGLRARFVVIATGLRPRPRAARLAGSRRLQRRAHPFQRLPKPRALPRPRRSRRRAGDHRLGGRDAARAGRRRAGARGLPDPAEPDGSQDHGRSRSTSTGWRSSACRCAPRIRSAGCRSSRSSSASSTATGFRARRSESRRKAAGNRRRPTTAGSSVFSRPGRIEIVAAVEGFDGEDVLLADGTRIQPQAVIAATGYRTWAASR